MSDHGCRCGVPHGVRSAIAQGWRGITVTCAPAAGPVTLVCAAPGACIEALAEQGVAVGLPAPSPGGRPSHPRVTFALVGDPETAMTLDLAFSDARALASRLARDAGLRLVWARAEDGAPVRADLVLLGPAIVDRLLVDAAHHGEWSIADPVPPGFSRLRWWRESMRSPRPRLARGDLMGAPVVVVAPARAADGPAAEPPPADLELAFPSGPPLPQAPAGIRLRFDGAEQAALAAELARQESVAILLLDVGGAWIAQVELALGEASRGLIADVAAGR